MSTWPIPSPTPATLTLTVNVGTGAGVNARGSIAKKANAGDPSNNLFIAYRVTIR
jgi:hypothetical protein